MRILWMEKVENDGALGRVNEENKFAKRKQGTIETDRKYDDRVVPLIDGRMDG